MTDVRIAGKTCMTKLQLNGLILTGGESSRMGSPKSDIHYHHKPHYQYLHELLSTFCNEVYLSIKQKSDSYPYPQIEDWLSFQSPLNGIYSAFKHSPRAAWLIVAIDMPLIDQEVLSQLTIQRDHSKVATCFYDSSGKRPEPLVSIWEPSALAPLEDFIKKGGFSPRTFLEQNTIHMVPVHNTDTLININSKEELDRFKLRNQKS